MPWPYLPWLYLPWLYLLGGVYGAGDTGGASCQLPRQHAGHRAVHEAYTNPNPQPYPNS